jgi:hypothetical protein
MPLLLHSFPISVNISQPEYKRLRPGALRKSLLHKDTSQAYIYATLICCLEEIGAAGEIQTLISYCKDGLIEFSHNTANQGITARP